MKKKSIALLLSCMVMLGSLAGNAATAGAVWNHVTVNSYDPKVNYLTEINKVLKDGGVYAIQVGAIYEKQRNLKIKKLGLNIKPTNYFERYKTAGEILRAIAADNKPKYQQEDLYWLARVISAEAGSQWIPDWVQRHVGSVVLNRVKSSRFSNSIKGVIFERGQYHCTVSGSIYREPNKRALENAKYILENGKTLPDGVLGQSEFVQGKIYATYSDPHLGTVTYFCYM